MAVGDETETKEVVVKRGEYKEIHKVAKYN